MTGFDISTAQGIYLGGNQVQSLYLGSTKIWPSQHDYSQDYFTVEYLDAGNLNLVRSDSSFPTVTYEYSTDLINWTTKTSVDTVVVSGNDMQAGTKVYIRAINSYYATYNKTCKFSFYGTGGEPRVNISGNIMSLLYGANFIGQTTLTNNYTFKEIFKDRNIISAENLVLPATTLKNNCYGSMFYGCSSLTNAPSILPATTLAQSCYVWMFDGCTSLTSAPELPATTLVKSCYAYMFNGCTSLTTAPELPATTLADNCYEHMFQGCTSLTTAPELPATILTDNCYGYMFHGCSSLNYIKCLATNNSTGQYSNYWVQNVGATGTFVKDANASWLTGWPGIPSGWTVIDAN